MASTELAAPPPLPLPLPLPPPPPPDEDDEEATTGAFDVDVVDSVDVSGIWLYVGVETLFWLLRAAKIFEQNIFKLEMILR